MKYAATLVGLLAVLAAPVRAEQQPALAPSSAWAVDYADERCGLIRDFGTGKSRVQLHVQSYGYWNSFRVMVAGPGVPKFDKTRGFASIQFPGDPDQREDTAIYGTMGEDPAASFVAVFSPYANYAALRRLSEDEQNTWRRAYTKPKPEYDATIDSISVKLERGDPIRLATGPMAEPLAALRTCIDDLIKSWGGDPEKQKTLSRLAETTRSSVSKLAYPRRMFDNGLTAFVPVRLTIDAEGDVTSCVVQVTLVDPVFKQAVCDGLAGKFDPALDAAGTPTASIFSTAVAFVF